MIRPFAAFRVLSPAIRGMGFMLVSTVAALAMHSIVRHLSDGMHAFEMAFFRNVLVLPLLAPLFFRFRLRPFRTRLRRLHLLRSVLTTASMLCFFTALGLIPLAQATALAFTAPVFAAALAVLFLGEVVRLRRVAAIVAGFLGTLVILRPGFEAIQPGQFLVVVSALTWGAAIVVTKRISREDTSLTTTLYMACFMAPMSLVPALFVWSWPSWEQFAFLVAAAVCGTAAQYCFSQALREADTGVVLPVDFFKLIWASVLGYLLFAEVPDIFTWAGGFVIFASAVYIAYRESQLKKAPIRYERESE